MRTLFVLVVAVKSVMYYVSLLDTAHTALNPELSGTKKVVGVYPLCINITEIGHISVCCHVRIRHKSELSVQFLVLPVLL